MVDDSDVVDIQNDAMVDHSRELSSLLDDSETEPCSQARIAGLEATSLLSFALGAGSSMQQVGLDGMNHFLGQLKAQNEEDLSQAHFAKFVVFF
jgi:hypothetical protein